MAKAKPGALGGLGGIGSFPETVKMGAVVQ